MPRRDFQRALDGILGHTPRVLERVFSARPFASIGALHAAVADAVGDASPDDQLRLLCTHGEGAGDEVRTAAPVAGSPADQGDAARSDLSPKEQMRIFRLASYYRARFGFPLIIGSLGATQAGVFAEFARRMQNDYATEFAASLEHLFPIMRVQLERLFGTLSERPPELQRDSRAARVGPVARPREQ